MKVFAKLVAAVSLIAGLMWVPAAAHATPLQCTITGTVGEDTLDGTALNDVICARGGNDTVNGRDGDDEVRGASGNDTLVAGTGNDVALGSDGDDVLRTDDGVGGNDFAGCGPGLDDVAIVDAGDFTSQCETIVIIP
jgi:Ca2+-binding RTX toxin-like protein